MGIHNWTIHAPLAVLDIETTGLNPARDHILEIAIYRLTPYHVPPFSSALNTLVQPTGPVAEWGQDIHGIVPADVSDAPSFEEIAALIVEGVAGAIVVAHNAVFDIGFLRHNFQKMDIDFDVPFICTQELPGALGLGPAQKHGSGPSMAGLCQYFNVSRTNAHTARGDAQALAFAMMGMWTTMINNGITTYGELAALSLTGFGQSFAKEPMRARIAARCLSSGRPKIRGGVLESNVAQEVLSYGEQVRHAALTNGFTRTQIQHLRRVRHERGITADKMRACHAQALCAVLNNVLLDDSVDDREEARIQATVRALRDLGWAPGD